MNLFTKRVRPTAWPSQRSPVENVSPTSLQRAQTGSSTSAHSALKFLWTSAIYIGPRDVSKLTRSPNFSAQGAEGGIINARLLSPFLYACFAATAGCGRTVTFFGKVTVKVLPSPYTDLSDMLPPSFATASLVINKPRPLPVTRSEPR